MDGNTGFNTARPARNSLHLTHTHTHSAIPPLEKTEIRHKLLACFAVEPDRKLAAQCAVSIAKIARMDYPNDWPDLLHSVMATVKDVLLNCPSADLQHHALYTFHLVVKTLCSKTIASSRRMLEQASSLMWFLNSTSLQKNHNCFNSPLLKARS